MKKNIYLKTAVIVLTIFCIDQNTYAQGSYFINNAKGTDMKLSGTSTLHNWTMDAKTLKGEAQFNISESSLRSIGTLSFSLPVENLKSDKKGMDKNAYGALKSDQFKNISFTLNSNTIGPKVNEEQLVKAKGDLKIAGVTKAIEMEVYCHVNIDKSVTCKGTQKIKMSDYNVSPPSFLFGAMKTGNDLKLDYNLIFKN